MELDAVVVGAGAAGLSTAIFALRHNPSLRLAILDGARRPGAKILVSGGSRCNVTNRSVTERDFNGGRPATIRTVLRALPVADTIAFFDAIGVALHEEANGKLFPDSNRSRDVLDALLAELTRRGLTVLAGHRVSAVRAAGAGFELDTAAGLLRARAVVLATGGLSLPKTGSDGAGLAFARAFGHTIVPTTPALAPLVLGDAESRAVLSGVTAPVRLDLTVAGVGAARIRGSMLWTHFGISGPAALDLSRHWLRAELAGAAPAVTASLCPDDTFETMDARWQTLVRRQPRASVQTALATLLPASLATQVLAGSSIAAAAPLATLTRDDRRALVHALLGWPLPVAGSRGYGYAEATAGGVELSEIDPSTMESRRRRGLFLVGEMLDVDGRLGGFNFQWAWSSAMVAGRALARRGATSAS
jgi:predicted Rossmann fold flavoprotein